MILARAPFRITLGGGGTDLPSYYERYGGFVLSAAIDKHLHICLNRPAADDLIRLKYSVYEEVDSVASIEHDLVRPALELLGIDGNVEIASMADIPAGTGLGSSSTYLVALLTALYELRRERLSQQALAELAFRIEAELAGHAVGKQDHYLASFGGITSLTIDTDGQVHVEPLNATPATVEQLRSELLLFFTAQSRGAQEILVDQRRATREGEATVVDSLHRTKEIGLEIKACLERGEVEAVGLLMHEHWENKKRRSGLISNGAIDDWYDAARHAGALGGKIVGAGGGGFLLLYAPAAAREHVRGAMQEAGLREVAYAFDFEGAKVMVNFR